MITKVLAFLILSVLAARAEGRPGTVEWSDGRKETGAISLTPGKDLRLFTDTQQVALSLAQVKEIVFKPEKEEMWEGFYFPNAGQATQVKTGEVYPIRYIKTQITLSDGKVVEGHLYTTVVYVEPDDGQAEKIVLLAKQTGPNGQKLADLLYPTAIRFEAGGATTNSSLIDLSRANLIGAHSPIVVARPDLTFVSADTASQTTWNVAWPNPAQLLFSVEAADGIHVSWPATEADAERQKAVDGGLKLIRDFYDTSTAIGSFADPDAGDIYSLVMMKRLAKSANGDGSTFDRNLIPWSLVLLRWKYDPDEKKVTLLNKVILVQGRTPVNSPLPTVFKQPELLQDISASK